MSNQAKTVIVILSVLLICSVAALAARMVYLHYFADRTGKTVVYDNYIDGGIGDSDAVSGTEALESATPGTETSAAEESASVTEGAMMQEDTDALPWWLSAAAAEPTAPSTPSAAAQANAQMSLMAIHRGNDESSEHFHVTNMLPGDTVSRTYQLTVRHHDDVDIRFSCDMTDRERGLFEVLQIKISRVGGSVIYEGSFADMQIEGYAETFEADTSTVTTLYYQIDVTLPTWVTNEHQAQSAYLYADLNWHAEDPSVLDIVPPTGDTVMLLLFAMFISLLLAVALLLARTRRRREEGYDVSKK